MAGERARRGVTAYTYAGLFAITLSSLMYEIGLTRIFSVTMWYHFAFVAISIALFGMTGGALLVYLRPKWFPQESVKRQLAIFALAYAAADVAGADVDRRRFDKVVLQLPEMRRELVPVDWPTGSSHDYKIDLA